MENIWDFRKNQHCFSNAFVRILYVTVGYFYVVLPLFHRSVTPQTKRGTLSPEGARLLSEAREKNKKRNKSCMNRQSRGYINEESAPKDALSIYAHMRAYLITIACRACGGRICNATGRFLERRRRARLPLSGTALLQKRNEPHP